MRDTLLLRADSITGDSWHWLRMDVNGIPQSGIQAGPIEDAAREAEGLRVVVLAPGVDCLLTTVHIPGRNRQKLLRAVPYALEEQLSDEVEQLHFALGAAGAGGNWPVAVINREYMDRLIAALDTTAMDVQQVVPEVLAVPLVENEISAFVIDDIVLVRNGPASGFAVDGENLDTMLAMQQDEVAAPVRLIVRPDIQPPVVDDYPGEVIEEYYSDDPLVIFAQGLDSGSINLLQGAYSRSGDWSRVWKPWRATAALLLAGILISLVAMGVDYYRLSGESEQLQAQIEQTFRTAVPGTQRVVNPRVQMQQQLDRLQRSGNAGADFLALLGKTGSVLKGVQGVELGGISFRAGRLDLDLTIPNLQSLDQLKQALAGSGGLEVEIQSATTGDDQRVQSRLRIQGVGT
ncbi:MAG TPA: type II secretion system protein GspL [Gammaproteobacteria bacterium]|nr:type II secretion system protein GspL [Gammaproteobacteria bacterium]